MARAGHYHRIQKAYRASSQRKKRQDIRLTKVKTDYKKDPHNIDNKGMIIIPQKLKGERWDAYYRWVLAPLEIPGGKFEWKELLNELRYENYRPFLSEEKEYCTDVRITIETGDEGSTDFILKITISGEYWPPPHRSGHMSDYINVWQKGKIKLPRDDKKRKHLLLKLTRYEEDMSKKVSELARLIHLKKISTARAEDWFKDCVKDHSAFVDKFSLKNEAINIRTRPKPFGKAYD